MGDMGDLTAFISPGRYVQGRGALGAAGRLIAPLGKKAMVIWTRTVADLVGNALIGSLDEHEVECEEAEFGAEITAAEIERLQAEARRQQAQVVVGVGGGKTIDVAKAVGFPLDLAVAVVPTLASTDAATSSLAVVYQANGQFAEYRFYSRNPDLVLVDSEVIAQAPIRYLVAGMGDALATWFEARTASAAGRPNTAGGLATAAGLRLARLCYETLLAFGAAARLAVQQRAVTPALERIIEANTLLSGLGFESGGLAAAHAIHNGLTILPQLHQAFHGEKVAVGTVAQLVLEGRPMAEVHEVVDFCLAVGLPVGYSDLGPTHVSREDLRLAANHAVAAGETIHNEPFRVTAEMVVDALLVADLLGRTRRQALGAERLPHAA